jgi:hypothetical protein
MGLQGAEFARGLIAPWRRAPLFGAAFFLMFPTALWLDGIGLVLLAAGWLPSFAPAARRDRLTSL